jgi:ribosomal protein L11 methyltransferase
MDLYAVVVSWLRIRLRASDRDAEAVADALTTGGALSVSIESASEAQRLQSSREAVPLWDENCITGLFDANANAADIVCAVGQTLDIENISYESDCLDDVDWEQTWREQFRPLQVAANLWIVPSWYAPPDPSAINVVLDPGLAFGTGAHATTRLCLNWLATRPLPGRVVIDYGCGSGILAIAALKLGAAAAIGVDTDSQALSVSRENAARNGVDERFVACFPQDLSTNQTAPIVVSNILSETLIELAPELTVRVGRGGQLALSGILADQANEVASAYAHAFDLASRRHDDWILLEGVHKR